MALWNGSTLNTNVLAGVFNQLYSKKFIDQVRNENALLYAILGKKYNGANGDVDSFERLDRTDGAQIEFRMLGLLDSYSEIPSGNETNAATPNYSNNMFGSTTYDLALFADLKTMTAPEYYKIRGSEAKTLSYADDVMQQIILSQEQTIGTKINGTAGTAPAQGFLGNWRQAVSDGVSTGETSYATYGLNRADTANVDARGTVNINTGNLTLGKINTVLNTIRTKGGKPTIGICDATTYGKIQQLILEFGHWSEKDRTGEWMEFGGQYVEYNGVKFLLEKYAPANTLGLIDPTSFTFYQSKETFIQSFEKANFLVASYVYPWEMFVQFLCKRPKSNGVMTGITS